MTIRKTFVLLLRTEGYLASEWMCNTLTSSLSTFTYFFLFLCVWTGQPGQRVTGSTLGNVVHRMNVALGERGDKLSHAEDKTVELMHKAQQFADTAHTVTYKYSCFYNIHISNKRNHWSATVYKDENVQTLKCFCVCLFSWPWSIQSEDCWMKNEILQDVKDESCNSNTNMS